MKTLANILVALSLRNPVDVSTRHRVTPPVPELTGGGLMTCRSISWRFCVILVVAGCSLHAPPADAVPMWNIDRVSYSYTLFLPGQAQNPLSSFTLTNERATPLITDDLGTFQFAPGLFFGDCIEFTDTNLLVMAMKTPANINEEERQRAEMFIDASAAAAGVATTNPGFLAALLLKEVLPLGESRVFARGELEISGSVRDPLGLASFTAMSDGFVFSAGRFADAILGDGIASNEVRLTPGGAQDFAYSGVGITFTGDDYRFDPIGGGLSPCEGTASFGLDCPTLIRFDIKHSMGAEIGLLASSSDFPSAGVSLNDLKLCVTNCAVPEPSTVTLIILFLALAGYSMRKRARTFHLWQLDS